MVESDTPSRVRTTETSLEIVDALTEHGSLTTQELSKRLELAESTVHRHLQTLREYNYVVKERGAYRVGLRFLTVGGIARNVKEGYPLAEDYVEQLAFETKERAQFVVREQDQRVFLFRQVGENAVRGNANIGKRGPLHSSSAGKAILAELPTRTVERIIREGLTPVTEHTITDPDELLAELERVRDRGYAVNREESAEGFHAVGASVTDPEGAVIGALSVSGPAHRMTESRIEEEVSDVILGTAQELELKIEYS